MSILTKAARLLLACVVLLVCSETTRAGDRESTGFKFPKNFVNIGFIHSNLSQPEFPSLRSNWGVALNTTRSYWIGKPIAGKLRLGIDVSWLDLNYTNYKVDMLTFDGYHDNFDVHEIELGLQTGIGAYWALPKSSGIHVFAHYNPCYSASYRGDDDIKGSFGNFLVAGLAVNWKKLGLGIEYRWGKAKYDSVVDKFIDDEEDDYYYDDEDNYNPSHYGKPNASGKIPTTISGFRAFVSLSF